MPAPTQDTMKNLLLSRMDAADFALLAPHLQPVRYPLHTILFEPGQPVAHAYFPADGILSLVVISPEGQRVEAGMIGRDGFAPTSLALQDDRTHYEGTVQMPLHGHRIATDAFHAAIARSDSLRVMMTRFAQALSAQVSFTALSNAVHSIEERLARWILLCDDRTASGELAMTHDYMSVMLAVRRPSVTTAIHVLEGNGLIRAERGLIVVRNRASLEEFAGDAYGAAEREYERLLGPLHPAG